MRSHPRGLIVLLLMVSSTVLSGAAPFLPEKIRAMDQAVSEAVAAKKIPGGVLWFEHDGQAYQRAYGLRAFAPAQEPISADTIYDAASLTKVIATTTAIMQLVERGRIELDAPVVRYLPAFGAHGKSAVTVRQLLDHHSGLRPDVELKPGWSGYDTGVALACNEKLQSMPGSTFVYSDINFIILGELVRLASGLRLDAYASREIFQPLRLRDTEFLPATVKYPRVAPTELTAGTMLRGVVHDPTARAMDGVAGHAGLFTTAEDLARFTRMLISGGQLDGVRILSESSVSEMTRVQTDGSNRRGLGWDIDSSFSGPRGRWFPAGNSYGHTGFTGTSVWIDPGTKSFVIFLANRVHPDGKGDTAALRRTLATLAAEAVGRDFGAVLNGIDVLVREDFARLRGLRVGLITNQTGRDRDGRSTIDLLYAAKDVKLVCLFSPEHGIRGNADETVSDSKDEKTQLPIHSLYGAAPPRTPGQSAETYTAAVLHAHAPRGEDLRDIDALVFDIQDIGARFYTYSATLGVALEAAALAKKKFIVLDRINPINGVSVEGPVMTNAPSFVGFHPVPVRHGMTLGELAQMYNAERHFGADLTVVRCENWARDLWLDQTGLAWINPSPSMRSLTAATLYPGLCLLESTEISMGRGTLKPFEQIGAPFIDGDRLATELNQAGLAGVRFEPITFTPRPALYPGPARSLKHADKSCGGVRVVVTDRTRCNAVDVGLALTIALQKFYPQKLHATAMTRLLGDDTTLAAIIAGKSFAEIKAGWSAGLTEFEARRKTFLLYR